MIRRKLIVQEDTPAIETVSGEKQYKISITVFLNSSTIREFALPIGWFLLRGGLAV